MDEAEIERTLERILPEIDRLVCQSLGRLDAATGSVAVRKVLHARFVEHAIAVAQDRFPRNAALARVLGKIPGKPDWQLPDGEAQAA